jgi:hypothetical protein
VPETSLIPANRCISRPSTTLAATRESPANQHLPTRNHRPDQRHRTQEVGGSNPPSSISRSGWIPDPEGIHTKVVAEPFEMLVEVEDGDPRMLSGSGDGEVGEGVTVGAVGALGGQIAH